MPLKVCSKCLQPKELTEFNRDARQKDGHRPDCKQCRREKQAQYRNQPDFKERNRINGLEFRRRDRAKPVEERSFRKHSATTRNEWRHRNPGSASAHNAVYLAVQEGTIRPVTDFFCVHCGQPAQEYHHHLGYERQNWLNVEPVCQSCHKLYK